MSFGGDSFDEGMDGGRLRRQLAAVWKVVSDERWYTLKTISHQVGAPEASVSARMRDFRKDKFGGHKVDKMRVPGGNGLWIYRLRKRKPDATEE
jgi:hypothetical protein